MGSAEEARISYVNTMLDTATRQDHLSQHWFFTCQCSLCLDQKYNDISQFLNTHLIFIFTKGLMP